MRKEMIWTQRNSIIFSANWKHPDVSTNLWMIFFENLSQLPDVGNESDRVAGDLDTTDGHTHFGHQQIPLSQQDLHK